MTDTPSQAARTAANEIGTTFLGKGWVANRVAAGECDGHWLVQVLHRFEQAIRANAERTAFQAIKVMMDEHVDNWPEPKKLKTAIALIDKTMKAIRADEREKALDEAAGVIRDWAAETWPTTVEDEPQSIEQAILALKTKGQGDATHD
jgi:hypothetical protein